MGFKNRISNSQHGTANDEVVETPLARLRKKRHKA